MKFQVGNFCRHQHGADDSEHDGLQWADVCVTDQNPASNEEQDDSGDDECQPHDCCPKV